jgi:hypothetical protein
MAAPQIVQVMVSVNCGASSMLSRRNTIAYGAIFGIQSSPERAKRTLI